MADDEGALAQLGSGNHGTDFLGPKLRVVVRSPAAVAHPRQINRRYAEVAGEVRRDVAPPVAMRTAAVNEQKAALARPRRLACPIASNGSGSPPPSRTATGQGGKWPTETNPAQAHGSSGDRLLRSCCSRRLHAHYVVGLAADRPALYRTKNRPSFQSPPSTAQSSDARRPSVARRAATL